MCAEYDIKIRTLFKGITKYEAISILISIAGLIVSGFVYVQTDRLGKQTSDIDRLVLELDQNLVDVENKTFLRMTAMYQLQDLKDLIDDTKQMVEYGQLNSNDSIEEYDETVEELLIKANRCWRNGKRELAEKKNPDYDYVMEQVAEGIGYIPPAVVSNMYPEDLSDEYWEEYAPMDMWKYLLPENWDKIPHVFWNRWPHKLWQELIPSDLWDFIPFFPIGVYFIFL